MTVIFNMDAYVIMIQKSNYFIENIIIYDTYFLFLLASSCILYGPVRVYTAIHVISAMLLYQTQPLKRNAILVAIFL